MKQLITIPRIIGIILLAIAVLSYQTQGAAQVVLLGIAGLTLVLTPKATGTKHWQEFLASLRLRKEFVIIMLYDILFWALLAILIMVLANVLRGPYEQLKLVQLGESVTLGTIGAYNEIIQGFFTTTIIALIIFWLLVVAAYSLSRGLIWLTLLEKPVQRAFFTRFSLLNLAWCTLWLVATLFFMATLIQPYGAYAFIILLVLYAHLTTVLHERYARTREFRKSLKDAFGIGLGRLGRFAHAYCYLFIVYVILSQFQRFAQNKPGLVITFLIFLIFMAWYRTFLRNILRHAA